MSIIPMAFPLFMPAGTIATGFSGIKAIIPRLASVDSNDAGAGIGSAEGR
jgi:hypothetical protein